MTVTLERRCENCNGTLGPSRADRRFCDVEPRLRLLREREMSGSAVAAALDADETLAEFRVGLLLRPAAD